MGIRQDKRASANRTFFRRALARAGVSRYESSPKDTWTTGMVGGGEVRATACATWPLVLREWREMEPVETGWRGLAFRDPWDKRPVVLIATDDLARLLALTEQMASEAGRFHAKS